MQIVVARVSRFPKRNPGTEVELHKVQHSVLLFGRSIFALTA